MSHFFGKKRGKHGDQVVLTSYKPLTHMLQSPLTSLTDSDDHRSASESAGNSKLSTDSVGSDIGRKFSHSSSSEHSQQSTGELLSTAAHNSDITENSNSEVFWPETDASPPQMEIDEDGDLLQINYPTGELTPIQQSVPSAVDTPPNIQVTVASHSQAFPMNPLKHGQHGMRHYSDSKMRRPWRLNVTNNHGSVKSLPENDMETETNLGNIHLLRMQGHSSVLTSGYNSGRSSPFGSSPLETFHKATSEQQKTERHNSDANMTKHHNRKTEVSPIPEDELLNTNFRKEEQEISELLSIGIGSDSDKLPEQVKLHIISLEAENEELKRQLSQNKPKSDSESVKRGGKIQLDDEVTGTSTTGSIKTADPESAKRDGEIQLDDEVTRTNTIGSIKTAGYLRCAEVVSETELEITNEAKSYSWEECGFNLSVPKKSLPEGVSKYPVNIKSSLTGHFELPEGLELVSAVYWVHVPGQFMKPVTIEIQHCANFSSPSQLHFIRASCTQKSLPYKFNIVDGGSFTLGSKYGALSTTRFSGNGIAKEVAPGEHSCQYCAQVYFTVKHLHDWYCHFVVTKDLDMCLAVVQRKFQQDYDIAPPITFGNDHITLDIPEDGAETSNGWRIVPQYIPVIEKDRVNNFSSEQSWVPECVLLLEWLHKDKSPARLEYKVKLVGAKRENAFFRILLHPEKFLEQQVLQRQLSGSVAADVRRSWSETSDERQTNDTIPRLLTIDDVLEVTNYLLDLTQTDIHNLGLTLGLNHPHLKNMASSETFRDDMIASWLQKEDQVTTRGVPTWETLVKALRDRRVNQTGVADKIETEKLVTM